MRLLCSAVLLLIAVAVTMHHAYYLGSTSPRPIHLLTGRKSTTAVLPYQHQITLIQRRHAGPTSHMASAPHHSPFVFHFPCFWLLLPAIYFVSQQTYSDIHIFMLSCIMQCVFSGASLYCFICLPSSCPLFEYPFLERKSSVLWFSDRLATDSVSFSLYPILAIVVLYWLSCLS